MLFIIVNIKCKKCKKKLAILSDGAELTVIPAGNGNGDDEEINKYIG